MRTWFIIPSLLLVCACSTKIQDEALFRAVSSDHSGIRFNNQIPDNQSYNILDYAFLYNGGGVGLGDFNNDGLLDIFFSGNAVSSRLYLNQGNLKFKDITETSGVATKGWCYGVSIIDINSDGLDDIFVSTGIGPDLEKNGNYAFINTTKKNGEVSFKECASDMNLTDTMYNVQTAWLDYDLDGDLDFFSIKSTLEDYPKNYPMGQRTGGVGEGTDILYENLGTQLNGLPLFKDVSEKAGIEIEGWSLGVTVSDFNQDGYPDIYVANDFISNDLLYVNNRDGSFTNKANDYLRHQSYNSMGVSSGDFDNDGQSELVVLDMRPDDNLRQKTMFGSVPLEAVAESTRKGYQRQLVRNVLQYNNGDNTYSEIGQYSGISSTDWSWAPLIADFDNDGLKDIYITNGYRKDITDLDFTDYKNQASSFSTPDERNSTLRKQLKIMKGVKKSNFFFHNEGKLKFTDRTGTSGVQLPSYSNGAAFGDLDLDGDLDIVVNNIEDQAFLFENRTNLGSDKKRNYLRINLGSENVLGTKVWLYAGDTLQYAEYYPQTGYLSTMEPLLHFGLNTISKVDSIRIKWPNDKIILERDVRPNQTLDIKPEKLSKVNYKVDFQQQKANYVNIEKTSLIQGCSKENSFEDFRHWPLHFRSYSTLGPVLEKGDVNNDGLVDLYIGGTSNFEGNIVLQTKKGSFDHRVLSDSLNIKNEDTGALFFDADNDGDKDLYCVSGSTEHYQNQARYQDRLYFNDGKGGFSLSRDALPKISSFGSAVVSLDFDKDGDLDLYVAGRIDPKNYPNPPRSYLMENKGGVFSDVTEKKGPLLKNPGMVTDVLVFDINGDNWQDLVLVGEYMPIQIYYNFNGEFTLDTSDNGLKNTNGWWNCLVSADFDGDGDLDMVAGNWGTNNPFKASLKEPLSLYSSDFDNNGSLDPILSNYIQGKEFIYHPRKTLLKQIPKLGPVLTDFKTYGENTREAIFKAAKFQPKTILRTFMLESIFIENLGKGKFKFQALPYKAQWFPIMDFAIDDINGDRLPDLVAVGNYSGVESLTGKYDAGNGLVLISQPWGGFTVMNKQSTGINFKGETRQLEILNTAQGKVWVVGMANDSIDTYWVR